MERLRWRNRRGRAYLDVLRVV
uniref:Uncharacterized protein n=1 Tax=Arundo donax TaxID=35708 RepID=A0A0A9B3T7_ARUDO